MKAEISRENKARFFSLYWGQKVILQDGEMVSPYVANLRNDGRDIKFHTVAILKPVSLLTEQEKEEISTFDQRPDNLKNYLLRRLGVFPSKECRFIVDYSDYLRSKGYAIGWMGLSVEEMVEAGWIQLACS